MTRTVERALSILDAFDADHPRLTLQQIGERIGLSKATTFRLVNSLSDAGYLVRLENQDYSLSLKLVRMAGVVCSTLSIQDIAKPFMSELSQRTGEAVTLNTIVGHERLCIDLVQSPSPLMVFVRRGEHVPLHLGATAKILLAYMPPDELEAVLDKVGNTAKFSRKALYRQLKQFRNQGYAHTSGERVVGITAVSVPLHDGSGRVRYCLAISGPAVRLDSRVDEFIRLALKTGADISARLGADAMAAT